MKKILVALMVLAASASMVFAADPDPVSVEVSTTIGTYAGIATNAAAIASTAIVLPASDVSARTIGSDGASAAFYVNTRSNNAAGVTVSYTMSALKGTGSNTDLIPVDVYLGDSATSDKTFSEATAEDGASKVIETSTGEGAAKNASCKVQVKAHDANWDTIVMADTYKADITFTLASN